MAKGCGTQTGCKEGVGDANKLRFKEVMSLSG